MITKLRGKIGKLPDLLSFVALVFRHGLEFKNVDWRVNSAVNSPRLCGNLVIGTALSNNMFFLFRYFLLGAILLCQAGYTLGSATLSSCVLVI